MTKDKSILIKNIYYMLSYAFLPLSREGYEDVEKEKFDNIYDLFAAILAKGIGFQLKLGLYREYLSCEEDLTVVRGKINMKGTLRNRFQRKRAVSCNHDELSENNILNQILKTTANLLLRCENVAQDQKANLKKEMWFFSNIGMLDPNAICWQTVLFPRNETYRMLISICQLVIEGMLLTTEEGDYPLASFKGEAFERLYEKFILEYYKKECPQVKADDSQISWALDNGSQTEFLPRMKSDVTLSKGDNVLIIDAKYYTHTMQEYFRVHKIHSDNLYQIFTYVKNKDAELSNREHRVSGMLLYAATDEDVQPNNTYSMNGNKISVRTLNLNCDFSEIKAQLNAIVKEHFS